MCLAVALQAHRSQARSDLLGQKPNDGGALKISELIGITIVTMGDGEKFDAAKDLLVEPGRLQTTALVLGGSLAKVYCLLAR